ncbi:MAG: hypothetical protein BJBARM5_0231 [Candidatus Parvarchaeum acidophilus ARMAN-5]|jgi:rhodanese-related sulfurtransferase|uniref:Rhodanese domain-containing protein n=1 Tax=Candidatus Parvarchaeum acidophilus ARMAN-5 TaxID=662762 RepID=D6GUT4_PARA5|nr:MAG: hypothetical protein BJBARM5_0231 [Candidatus Parvarchaeum acidophilus ARMAN-5]
MNNDISLEKARKLLEENKKQFFWVGEEEHLDTVREILDISSEQITYLNPEKLYYLDNLKVLEGNIFVCYHGNTSRAVASYLSEEGIKAYSLIGGITSLSGDIF